MAELYYKRKRDRAFMTACEKSIKENSHRMSILDCVTHAIQQPTSSFFLSPDDYSRIIKNRKMCPPLNAEKAELHKEILSRYHALKGASNVTDDNVILILEEQTAPRFYLSPRRAMHLYYNLLKDNQRK